MREMMLKLLLGWLGAIIGPFIQSVLLLGKETVEYIDAKVKAAETLTDAAGNPLTGMDKFKWVSAETAVFLKQRGKEEAIKYVGNAIQLAWTKLDKEQGE